MSVIDRQAAAAPSPPREVVTVEPLGGDVEVRGLLLSDRLELSAAQRALRQPLAGETDAQARERAGAHMVPITLARTVHAADGKPLWTVDQWQSWGSSHIDEALRLFGVAMRLMGHDLEAAEKN